MDLALRLRTLKFLLVFFVPMITALPAPAQTFQAASNFPTGTTPQTVASGDFNHDGKIDLATANFSDNTVTILLGNGDGTFQAPLTYPVGSGPAAMIAGDFNGDGNLDLAVANENGNTVSILLGNGDGTLQAAQNYAVGGSPISIVAGDFNGDGKLDLAVTNISSNSVTILLGTGNGTFQPAMNFGVGNNPIGIATADLNGDGKADLVVGSAGNNPLSVLMGNGDGTFQAAVPVAAGSFPRSIAIADLNGDGTMDLAVTNENNVVNVLLGNGDGTFRNPVAYSAGQTPVWIIAMSLTGSGKPDLAVACANSDELSILRNNGDGTFAATVNYNAGYAPYQVVAADLNGDGKVDLVTTDASSNDVAIFLGNGDGTLRASRSFASSGRGQIAFGDFNSDGKLDVTLSGDVHLGNGDGTIQAGSGGNSTDSVATADLNGDGKLDQIIAHYASNTLGIRLGNGDGTFQAEVTYSTEHGPEWVAVGDFNGDGKPDLALANVDTNNVSIFLGNGDGTFQPRINFSADTAPVFVAAADFNGDGKLDLAVVNANSNDVSILLGNGDGTFQPAVNYSAGQGLFTLAIGDFNNDGKPDLAVANGTSKSISILLGNGDGTFQSAVNYATAEQPYGVAVLDYDADGNLDLAVTNRGYHQFISILKGNGDGTFQTPINFDAGQNPLGLVTADFNGDGAPDVIAANSNSYSFTVLLNARGTYITVSSSANPSFQSQAIVLTAAVAGSLEGTGVPSGNITFLDGITPLGTVPLSTGQATLPVSGLAVGAHSITAVYSGDSAFNPHKSAPFTEMIIPPAPVVSLSPTSLSFPNQILGIPSAVQVVTLSNTGVADLSITVSSSTGEFAQTNTCGSIVAAGTNCAVTITFTPAGLGPRSGSIILSDNAANSPQIIPVRGIGIGLVSITVAPAAVSARSGQQGQFTATGIYSDGSMLDLTGGVLWGSSNPAVATISATGQYAATGAGTAIIQAMQGLIGGTAQINVVLYTPTFAYVANTGSNDISAYSVDASSGAWTPVQGSPFPDGAISPNSVATSPSGNFVFVANQCSVQNGCSQGEVTVFSVNPSNGSLTPVPGSPFLTGGYVTSSVSVSPSGNFVFVSNECLSQSDCSQGAISVFAVNPATGILSLVNGSPFPAGGSSSLAVTSSADGSYVLVANECFSQSACTQGSVSVFSVDSSTGSLTAVPGSPFASGGYAPLSIAVSAGGKYVYLGDDCLAENSCPQGAVSVLTFDPSTGSLTPLPGSPFATGGYATYSVSASPTGNFLFAANECSSSSNCSQGSVSVFSVDPISGALTLAPGNNFAAGQEPLGILADPSGGFVYTSNAGPGNVTGFAVNPVSGALTAIPGSPFAAGSNPRKMAIAAVKHTVQPTLSLLQIIPANPVVNLGNTLQLQLVANLSDGSSEFLTASASWTSASANTVALSSSTPGQLTGQTLGTSTITAVVGSASTSTAATVVAQVSRFGYAANTQANTISGFGVDALNGVLVPLPGSPYPAASTPNRATVAPSGTYAYVANGSNSISEFSIAPGTGALTELPGSPLAIGNSPDLLIVHPSGQTAYSSQQGNNPLLGFKIDPTAGLLTQTQNLTTADSIAMDAKGRYLFAGKPDYSYQYFTGDYTNYFYYVFCCGYYTVVYPYCSPYAFQCVPIYSTATVPAEIYSYKLNSDGTIQGGAYAVSTSVDASVVTRMDVDPTARYLYAVFANEGYLQLFLINSGGSLTAGTLTYVGPQSTDAKFSPSGRFLLVPNQASQVLHVYAVDGSSGNISEISGSPFSIPPNASISIDPSERFVYVGSASNASMSVYSMDPSSGALTQINGSPFAAGSGTTNLALVATTPSPGATLASLQVTPANTTVAAGLAQRFMALGTLSDGTPEVLSASSLWSSSNASVAGVDPTGNATTLQAGTTTITATNGGVSGSATLTAGPATLVSLALTPANPSTPLGLAQQFAATGTYTDGSMKDLTSSAAWSSSAPSVSTVTAGLASALSQGNTTITATFGSASASTALTVGPPQIAANAILPANPSVALGQTVQFTAISVYTDGSTQPYTGQLRWLSSDTTVATIDANGFASTVGQGSITISAFYLAGSMYRGFGGTTLTVGPPLLLSLALAQASPSILPGATQQFNAIGTYTNGATDVTTAVTWSSSQPLVATISNAAGTQGLASGISTGIDNITATIGTFSATTTLTVNFATTGSLNTARYLHTATLLNNGMVMIAGGSDVNGNPLGSTEIYNPTAGAYTSTGSLNTARYFHTATVLNNGMVLIVGGYGGSGALVATTELYNPATGMFTSTGSLNSARYNHTATLLNNGMVLIVGGYGANGVLASAELYNPANGTFTSTGSLNNARYYQSATMLNSGQVLVAGGYSTNTLSSAELFNPATGTFTSTGNLNNSRYLQTATLLNNGMVLIAGGYSSNAGVLASAELYNPDSGMFTSTGSMNNARYYQSATLLNNGQVLVAGGLNDGYLASAELYDSSAGSFTGTGGLNTARYTQTATLLNNGQVLTAGGYNGATLTSSELYVPTTLNLANLASIAVSPAAPVVLSGASQRFVATGTFSDSNTQTLQSVTWSSSNPAVATISNDVTNLGTAITLSGSSTTISACDGSVCGSTSLTVDVPIASLSASSLTFANQNVGSSSAAQLVTLTNTGTGALLITALGITGTNPGDFLLTNNYPISPATLGAGANCVLSVMFDPSATGSRTATISITDNAAGSPQNVSLTGTGTLPSITLTPATLAFGNQVINTTSAAKTVQLSNPGSGTLTISSIAITGANLTEFAETNTCGGSVGPAGTCTITVTFTPASAVAETASVTVTDDSAGSPHNVSLTGTGLLPFTATPSPLAFGNQGVNSTSAAKTVTLKNNTSASVTISSTSISGTNPADFTQTTTTCGTSLASKATCTINITFTPSTSAAETAKLTITDSAANSPQTVSLTGTGVAQATTSVATLAFGNQGLSNPSAAKTVTLTNNDSTAMALLGNSVAGTNASAFAISATTCGTSLAGHSSCTISVTFTPATTGAMAASLSIADGASNSPQMVSLTGTGVQPVTLSAATLAFGNQGVSSTSAAKSVTVTNNNSVLLSFASIAIAPTPGDFVQSVTTCGASIAAHSSCTVSVTYDPSVLGAETATLTLTDTAGNSPQNVSLTGTGVAQFTLSATSIAFANQAFSTTSIAKSVTLTNNTSAAVAISSISMGGTNPSNFMQSATTCGASLNGHSSCSISFTFSPSAAVSYSATASISDGASNSPQTISLTGTGIVPVSVTPATLVYANQTVGTTSGAKTVTVKNNLPGTLTNLVLSFAGTNAGDFLQSATTCTTSLASGSSCTVSIEFKPSATGARTGILNANDSATTSPQSVSLSGTGK